ncbi:nitroreductase family protein [Actinoallomurus spadix]|uniref:Nitroreductase family protein n=1 Tax=Actinoallomurus spadix TaxID=79912 RepID=A0ABN0X450_9ACTN
MVPPEEIAAFVIDAASQAPSVHNTQPWWFGVHGSRVTVHADTDRRLDVADPDGREMLISCGAALFNLRLAARHLGHTAEVRLWPDPERPTLLADVDLIPDRPATADERRMFEQITRRHSHRGGFTADRPPTGLSSTLGAEARREGAVLRVVADLRAIRALAGLSEVAEQTQRLSPDHVGEIARWAPAPGNRRKDGVQAGAYPREAAHTDPHFAARDFARGQGWGRTEARHLTGDRTGTVVMVMTREDTAADWLAAGQALQRVLLRAAEDDVSAAFHTQALEFPELRAFVRERYCDGAHPQVIMRLGHAEEETGGGVRRPEAEIARDEP